MLIITPIACTLWCTYFTARKALTIHLQTIRLFTGTASFFLSWRSLFFLCLHLYCQRNSKWVFTWWLFVSGVQRCKRMVVVEWLDSLNEEKSVLNSRKWRYFEKGRIIDLDMFFTHIPRDSSYQLLINKYFPIFCYKRFTSQL